MWPITLVALTMFRNELNNILRHELAAHEFAGL